MSKIRIRPAADPYRDGSGALANSRCVWSGLVCRRGVDVGMEAGTGEGPRRIAHANSNVMIDNGAQSQHSYSPVTLSTAVVTFLCERQSTPNLLHVRVLHCGNRVTVSRGSTGLYGFRVIYAGLCGTEAAC